MRIQALPRNRAGELALEIYRRTLEWAKGDNLVQSKVWLEGETLNVDDLTFDLADYDRIIVAGAGKASAAMAKGLEQVLGNRIDHGLIVTKYFHVEPLEYCETIESGHPIPDENSLMAGSEMLALAQSVTERDLVLFMLSGGASALMEAPVEGVSLEDLQFANRELLASGATILTLNAIRSRLSQIKAGGLARAFGAATVVVLALSDVPGDRLGTIGSGPFVPSSAELDVSALVRAFGLSTKLPPNILKKLDAPSDPSSTLQPEHRIIGSARLMGKIAVQAARSLGLRCDGALPLEGEAKDYPAFLKAKRLFPDQQADCIIAVGEPVATVTGDGLGGRAQEMACVFAQMIDDLPDIAVLVAGSDGTDGPTDAAGALVDGQTLSRAMARGMTVEETLAQSDSYHFHEAAGTLVKTGPTGTNLNDIVIVVRTA